jgi:thiol peroxidase
MAKITLKGNPIHTSGDLPAVGGKAPDFQLTGGDMGDVSLASYAGKKKVLNIVPSLDTPICGISLRTFHERATGQDGVVVLNISRDLPFAQKRFCAGEGIEGAVTLSELRNRDFGPAYGMDITDGPLAGVLGRAVVVVDENDNVVHTELVPEIGQEPDYDAALKAIGG